VQSNVNEPGSTPALLDDLRRTPLGEISAELADKLLRLNDNKPDDGAAVFVARFGSAV
jgi:hypothetical protein